MTEVAIAELTADEARLLEKSFLSGLNEAQDAYEQIVAAKAWKQLGHDTFADWWSRSVQPVMRALSMRPTREIATAVVEQVRAEEADLPPAQRRTQRELADMVGVTQQAISSRSTSDKKLSGSDLEAPSPRLKPEIPVADLVEFPELEHYADRPAKAIALATQLRSFEPAERKARRETLAKVIQAERDGRLAAQPDPRAELIAKADRLFVAVNEAAQTAEKIGDIATIEAAVAHADPAQIQLWHEQFTDLAATLIRLASACRPKLRRVQ